MGGKMFCSDRKKTNRPKNLKEYWLAYRKECENGARIRH
jgi:hypothetical protein